MVHFHHYRNVWTARYKVASIFWRSSHFSVHKNIMIDKNGYTKSKYAEVLVVLSPQRLNGVTLLSLYTSVLSQFSRWELCFKGACGDRLGCVQVWGQADLYMSPICCHLQRQKWQWIDGALYIYQTWSGKSVGKNKYCVEINAKNSKFHCLSSCIPAPSLSH